MRSPKSLDLGRGPGGNSTTAESSPAELTKEDRTGSCSVCAAAIGTDGMKAIPTATRNMSHVMGSPRGREALGGGAAVRFLVDLLFFFLLDCPPNLVIVILALQLVPVFFGHLSVDRLGLRRLVAALLRVLHYGAACSS